MTGVIHLARGQSVVHRLQPRINPIIKFIRSLLHQAQFLLVVDTHSDYRTGHIQYGLSRQGGPLVSGADDVSAPTHLCSTI
jgi:hypothetical protein